MPAFLNSMLQRRDGERDQEAAGEDDGHQRALEDAGEDAPHMRDSPPEAWRRLVDPRHAALLRPALRPSDEISAGSAVSEPSMATATTSIVPTPNEANIGLPARNMPGHGGHDREAGDQHGAAGRGRRDLERGLGRAALAALLHLAAEVEHGVVDADREADERRRPGRRRARAPAAG